MENYKLAVNEQVKTDTPAPASETVYQSGSVDEKEYNKLIRKPQSPKRGKLLKQLDELTSSPRAVENMYRAEHGLPLLSEDEEGLNWASVDGQGEFEVDSSVSSDAGYSAEDMAEFRRIMMEKIAADLEWEEDLITINATVTSCGITGCVIHSVDGSGNIEHHYTPREVQAAGPAMIKAHEIIAAHPNDYVEIHKRSLVHRHRGDVVKVYDL